MNISSILAVGAVLASSALGWYGIRSNQRQIAELRGELRTLAAVGTTQHDAESPPPARVPSERIVYVPGPALPTGSAAENKSHPAERERSASAVPAPPPKPAEIREQFEVAFDTERSDASWSAVAKRRAEDRLRNVLTSGSEVRSVDCRSSMCRIETRHDDVRKYRDFIQETLMNPERQIWNGGTFSTLLEDQPGNAIAVTFLARENQALKNPMSMD